MASLLFYFYSNEVAFLFSLLSPFVPYTIESHQIQYFLKWKESHSNKLFLWPASTTNNILVLTEAKLVISEFHARTMPALFRKFCIELSFVHFLRLVENNLRYRQKSTFTHLFVSEQLFLQFLSFGGRLLTFIADELKHDFVFLSRMHSDFMDIKFLADVSCKTKP